MSARRSGRQVSIRQLVPYLAMAAMLVLVTASIVLVQRSRPSIPPAGIAVSEALPASRVAAAPDPGLLSASEQHFQRSKLVLLDLATRDVDAAVGGDWTFERSLATTLLDDTRLYRRAAEQRDMSALAGVMRDLELVLLQTSMSEAPDRDSVERLQRLIRQRDLLTKMVAYEGPPSGLWYDRDGAGGRPPAGRTRVRGQ